MIEIWVGLSYQDKITTSDSFLSQSLWHNFPISVMDKPIFYKNWQQSGITSENQIVKQKPSIFLAPWEFESMYQTKVYLLVFYGKSSAQKMIWKCHNWQNTTTNVNHQKNFSGVFMREDKPSRLVYGKRVRVNSTMSIQLKWNGIIQEDRVFKLADCMNYWISFSIFHQTLATNRLLVKKRLYKWYN